MPHTGGRQAGYLYKRRKVWFLNGDLVSIEHTSKSQGLIALKNWTQDRIMYMSVRDFKKARKHAYSTKEVAELLNYKPSVIKNLYYDGVIPKPMGRFPNGKIVSGGHVYYSEEKIFLIRDILAGRHWGKARKDGMITNNKVPTESELWAKVNNSYFVYVQNEDGEFIPTFPETI